MGLEQRIAAILECDVQKSPWESLISLFQADREAFYTLACEGVSPEADQATRELAELATNVRAAVRESYDIEPSGNGANLVSYSGKSNFIPDRLVAQVEEFLREIDGKTTATTPGKDYEGTAISEAEARFKLGDESMWQSNRAKLKAMRNAQPFVLRLDKGDLEQLAVEPAYVTYELLNCARRTILAPTSVFRGLKRGEDSSGKVNDGWAFCGKPRRAYGNDGNLFALPDGMVYLVYADEEGFVFDWDWVKENPDELGYPLDWRLRFDQPHQLEMDAVLELPPDLRPKQFDPTQARYSNRGDCMFCYITEEVSYADRINSDLTVFKKLGTEEVTGFKVKNVRRILQRDRSIVLDDAPGLTVFVDSLLLASFRQHKDDQDARVDVYTVVIRALNRRMAESPKVTVPEETDLLATE